MLAVIPSLLRLIRTVDRTRAASLSIAGVILLPTLLYGMGYDQGVFAYMGWALLHGQWPYVGAWEHNLPGAVFVHALQTLLTGDSMLAFRVFDVVYQMLCISLIYALSRRLAGPLAAFIATICYAWLYLLLGFWDTGQRDGFALLWLLLAVWAVVQPQRRGPWWPPVAAGLSIGISVLMRPTYVLIDLPLAAALLISGRASGYSRRTRFGQIALLTALSLMPAGLLVAGYALTGRLYELWESVVLFNRDIYITGSPVGGTTLRRYGALVGLTFRGMPIWLWFLALSAFWAGVAPRRTALKWLLLSIFTIIILSIFLQGKAFRYHFIPALGFASILAGAALAYLAAHAEPWLEKLQGTRIANAPGWGPGAAVLSFMLVMAVFSPGTKVFALINQYRTTGDLMAVYQMQGTVTSPIPYSSLMTRLKIAAYLRTHTRASDMVQQWDNDVLTYYLAQRLAASRFNAAVVFTTRVNRNELTPMQRRWLREFLAELQKERPRYMVVRRYFQQYYPQGNAPQNLDADYPEINRFVQNYYVREAVIDDVEIYRRAG